MFLGLVLIIFLQTTLGQFVARIFEENHTAVEGARCAIYRTGSTPIEEVFSDAQGICTFVQAIQGGVNGDIISVRDVLSTEPQAPTTGAPHARIQLKIWDETVILLVPLVKEPAPGEIVVFLTWTATLTTDLDLHVFLPEGDFDCSHIYDGNTVCNGQNEEFCNSVAQMETLDGLGDSNDLTTNVMGLEIVRITRTSPGIYKFYVNGATADVDVMYLGIAIGGRIAFDDTANAAAEVVPQSIMVSTPATQPAGGPYEWWHALTLDVIQPSEATINCQRTLDTYKVNHFCNGCAPATLVDSTALADSPGAELVEPNNWADCLWAVTQSSCVEFTPPTFEQPAKAKSYGDPHFKTNDDFWFDIFNAGTYYYLKSVEKQVHIQARLRYLPPNDLTYNGQVVIQVEKHKFEFADLSDGSLIALKDGKQTFFKTPGTRYFGAFFIHRVEIKEDSNGETNFYFFLFEGELEIQVTTMKLPPSYTKRDFDFRGIEAKSSFFGLTEGVLGDFNNNPFDDFKKGGTNYWNDKDERGGLFLWAEQWEITTTTGSLPGTLLLQDGEPDFFSEGLDAMYEADNDYRVTPNATQQDPTVLEQAQDACSLLYDFSTRLFEWIACVRDASNIGGPEWVMENPSYQSCTDDCNNHGACFADNTCSCAPSYEGDFCEIPVCVCLNGGTCLQTGFCACVPGFVGAHCETTPDCSHLQDCNVGSGKGVCVQNGLCECSYGSTGPHCGVACHENEYCTIQLDPVANTMICYGSADAPEICGSLPDDPYTCYTMEDASVNDQGHCTSDDVCDDSATNSDAATCLYEHCFCKNAPDLCTGLDCSSCAGCSTSADCITEDADLITCCTSADEADGCSDDYDNQCRCKYEDKPCNGNDCTGLCPHQADVSVTPSGMTIAAGEWWLSSKLEFSATVAKQKYAGPTFAVPVQIPAGMSAADVAQAFVTALQADASFNSFCTTEWTGTDWHWKCTPLDGSVALEFEFTGRKFVEGYGFNGISFKLTDACFNREDCLGAPSAVLGCMSDACVCLFGGTCNGLDCSQCTGCVEGVVDCSTERGPSDCIDNQCSCTLTGTCVNTDCSDCDHPPYVPEEDYWCGVDGEHGTFKGFLLHNDYEIPDRVQCCLSCRADTKCKSFSFDGIPPTVCKFFGHGAKPLIRPGYMNGWHHGKLRYPDPES